jgi:hypothetical protein
MDTVYAVSFADVVHRWYCSIESDSHIYESTIKTGLKL